MFDSLWPHGLQQARLFCPPPSPGVHWNSRPLSQWCSPAISSSATLSPFVFSLFQNQENDDWLFQWVISLHHVAKALKLQHQSFRWILSVYFLQDWPYATIYPLSFMEIGLIPFQFFIILLYIFFGLKNSIAVNILIYISWSTCTRGSSWYVLGVELLRWKVCKCGV